MERLLANVNNPNSGDGIKSNIISKYFVIDNQIHILYVNGESEVVENTYENLKKLNTEMLNQAIQIIKNCNDPKFIVDQKFDLARNTIIGGTCGVGISFFINNLSAIQNADNPTLQSIIAVGTTVLASIATFLYINSENKSFDATVEKYRIYLNNYGVFESHKHDTEIYNGSSNNIEIDINNLDEFTLNDVKVIYENIMKKGNSRKRKLSIN